MWGSLRICNHKCFSLIISSPRFPNRKVIIWHAPPPPTMATKTLISTGYFLIFPIGLWVGRRGRRVRGKGLRVPDPVETPKTHNFHNKKRGVTLTHRPNKELYLFGGDRSRSKKKLCSNVGLWPKFGGRGCLLFSNYPLIQSTLIQETNFITQNLKKL